ncbi:hypothetical protein M2326_002463 [Flavobacterium sp. 7A]|nr:hypothetical protein [Flavobacterium sp. 7A]
MSIAKAIKMDNPEQRFPKIFNLDDRLIRFARESNFFSHKLDKTLKMIITKTN